MFCVQERKYPDREREEEEYQTYQNQQPRKQLLNSIIAAPQHHQVSLARGHENQENLHPNIHHTNNQQLLLKASTLAQEFDAMRGVKTQQQAGSNPNQQANNSKSKSFAPANSREPYHNQKSLENEIYEEDLLVNKPHPREFYLKLIETEKKIQKGHFFQGDITFLIEMYTKCIEYFDSVQDPIKCYFEDKISSTLSSTTILSVLMSSQQSQKSQQSNQSEGIQRSSTAKDGQSNNEKGNHTGMVHLPTLEKGNHRPRTLSEQKKHDRMKAHYNIEHIKLQQQSDIEKVNFIKNQEKQVQAKEQHKQNVISSQNKDIQERLRMRKEKNLIQQSEKLLSNIRYKSDSISGPSSGIGEKSQRTLNTNSSQSSDLRITEEDLQYDDRSTRGASDHQNNKYGKSNTQEELDGDFIERQNVSENSQSSSSDSSDSSSTPSSRSGSQNSCPETNIEKEPKKDLNDEQIQKQNS